MMSNTATQSKREQTILRPLDDSELRLITAFIQNQIEFAGDAECDTRDLYNAFVDTVRPPKALKHTDRHILLASLWRSLIEQIKDRDRVTECERTGLWTGLRLRRYEG